jgi:hypothetical protein
VGVQFVFEGLKELEAYLRQLPRELGAEAADIVISHAEIAETSLRQVYPPGELRDNVHLTVERNEFGAIAFLQSLSGFAHMWEYGTKVRETQKKWKRGAEPAHGDAGVIAIGERWRRRMNEKLIALVRRAGFIVNIEGFE